MRVELSKLNAAPSTPSNEILKEAAAKLGLPDYLRFKGHLTKKISSFSTMAFFCSPPKTRKSNRNHYSVASHDLHNHSYPSPDQEYLQEIQKTKQYRPSSKNYAFSANDAQTSTMTLRRLIESTSSLPPKTYTIVLSPLITEESILKC